MSLGSDCACTYQARKYQKTSLAYPFDWIKSDKINMICDSLDSKFSIFFDNYDMIEQSDKFDNFDTNTKSRIKIKLRNSMILPHESDGFIFDKIKYEEKYRRRIKRFYDVVTDKNIKKIFIRCDNKKIKQSEKDMLYKSLNEYGCVSYEIRFISYSDYVCTGEFNWQRDYIDWNFIFNFF